MKNIFVCILLAALPLRAAVTTLGWHDGDYHFVPADTLSSNFTGSGTIKWNRGSLGRLTGYIPADADVTNRHLTVTGIFNSTNATARLFDASNALALATATVATNVAAASNALVAASNALQLATAAVQTNLTAASNALITATSNNVRVAAGTGVTVTPSSSGGIRTYTVAATGGGGVVMEAVSANRTYYVDPAGSDLSDGSVGAPWLTIQYALDWIGGHLIIGGAATVTLQMADGTYTEAVKAPKFLGGGVLALQGNVTTPANTLLTSGGTTMLVVGTSITLVSFEVRSTASSSIHVQTGGRALINGVRFGAATTAHVRCQWGGFALFGSGIAYTISGGAQYHWLVESGSTVTFFSGAVTMSGSPAFSTAFARATRCATIDSTSCTFTGTTTGKRYEALNLSTINVGAGANYFPGNAVGSVSNGGLYL